MNRLNFWSPEAIELLKSANRQDLIDRGDALAERVSALVLTALNRLKSYSKHGDLYNGRGGLSLLNHPDAIQEMDEFVNTRLRNEISALEQLLSVFDDLCERQEEQELNLPAWY